MNKTQNEHKRFIVIGYNVFCEFDTKEEVDKTIKDFYRSTQRNYETLAVLDTEKKTKTVINKTTIK